MFGPIASWGRRMRGRRRLLIATGVTALALGALLALAVARYLPAVRALTDGRDALQQAREVLASDPTHLDAARIDQVEALLQRAAADFDARSSSVETGAFAGMLAHVPGIGGQVDAVRTLRRVGRDSARLGLDVIPVARHLLGSTGNLGLLSRLQAVAVDDAAALNSADGDLAALRRDAAELPSGWLAGPLAHARDIAVQTSHQLDQAGPAIDLIRQVPAVAGTGTHRYLLLLFNPAEERPGGGFIGAIGEVALSNGAITEANFGTSDLTNQLVTNIPAPPALDRYLFHGAPLQLSDAAWSPDFPTTAAAVERFHAATGRRVDGVIGVDPVALSYVLGVLGPVQVAPYPQVVSADNTLVELNRIINEVRPNDPGKAYLAPFGHTMLDRVLSAPLGRLPALAAALQRGVLEKHVLLFFNDPALQQRMVSGGGAGALAVPNGDAILVADANLGGTKGDLFVQRRYDLSAQVDSGGTVHDTLRLSYTSPLPDSLADSALLRPSGGAYRDYLRLYLPPDAHVNAFHVAMDGHPVGDTPESISTDSGRTVVAYWLVVPAGHTMTVTLTHSGRFSDSGYVLRWQKELGALPVPVSVAVTQADGSTTRRSFDLASDWNLHLAD